MNDVVIRAEGLGKKFLIGHQASRDGYVALRDVLARSARGFFRSAQDMARGRQLIGGDEVEEFWALKDVNFDIRRGDVVGIIGRNGAGKSTLLKILSRITEPSAGRVKIKGRIASLLEVGTGFHPELSGRENIFLNGAILGMRRAEIRQKFDEIVAFAEVERFLDTPVKRYSSGMYVRLAFAVAAHLEPEILVVDEVLAVGDAQFQKKCLGKMQDIAGQGRTVLFVSHNLSAIESLCPLAIVLNRGVSTSIMPAQQAIASYLSNIIQQKETWDPDDYLNPYFIPYALSYNNGIVSISGLLKKYVDGLMIAINITTAEGQVVVNSLSHDAASINLSESEGQRLTLNVHLPTRLINSGIYRAQLLLFIHNREFIISPERGPSVSVQVELGATHGSNFHLPRPGVLAFPLRWSLQKETSQSE